MLDQRPLGNARVAKNVVLLAACLLLCGGGSSARAHDYWLEPTAIPQGKGEELVVRLQMGNRLKTEEERPLQKDRLVRFDLYGDRTARRDLLAAGQENQVPAARVHMDPGSALVVMDRKARPITMEAAKFNQYLADEGLDAIIAQRARLGQTDAPGRESYTRCLKTLVRGGNPAAVTANTLYKRRVGQRLEILLENDPDRIDGDGKLTVKVLFEGNPLPGAKVFACRRSADDQPPYVVTATTSARGLAEFKLDQPGSWLVRTVYMRAAGGGSKAEPQWESFWSTYTFNAHRAPEQTAAVPAPTASSPRP